MSKRKGVTPTFKELVADLKPMTFSQKLDHLWSYYKEWLLIALLIAIVITIAVSSFINANKDYKFKGMMVNISMSQEGYRYMTDDFLAKIGTGDKNEAVVVDYTNFTDLADPTSTEDNYGASLLLIARVSGQMLDYALIDQFALEFYMTQDVFLDLTEFFTPEELERLGDRVIWAQPEPEDEEDAADYEEGELDAWAIALDVTDLPFFQDNCGEEEKVYFTMAGNAPDMEGVRNLLDYIMAWEPAQ
jgi:hypothetical protein